MYKILVFIYIVILSAPSILLGQSRYEVMLSGFSSDKYDEFSPVLFNGKIVFCSNQENEMFISFKSGRNRSLFNIFNTEPLDSNNFSPPEVFSRNLLSPFNDGPVAFHPDGEMLVYSRNINADVRARNVVDLNNNLGLFFADLNNGEWINLSPFEYNDIKYSITTPCFSPDGRYLYFGSNMPGGYGGTDIYRSRLSNGEWEEPENLGETINTPGNEVYPFMANNSQLFFASDGHPGLGMKDIFFSIQEDSSWSVPVLVEAPINSNEDDFGFFTDQNFSYGYFSSNRSATDDIFSFTTLLPQLFNCDSLLQNNYCFEFWDDQNQDFDTIPVSYEWEFSDGSKIEGLRVVHCLPGAGEYWAKLHIIDESTDKTFLTQSTMEFELVDHVQPYITSSDTVLMNLSESFSGMDSNLPGFTIDQYIWDFGDGGIFTGMDVDYAFSSPGIHYIKLGVIGHADGITDQEMKCIIKPVIVVTNNPKGE